MRMTGPQGPGKVFARSKDSALAQLSVPAVALYLMLFALCFPAHAQQQPKIPRIGFLASYGAGPDPRSQALRDGLRELGYVERKNIVIEYSYAAGNSDRLVEFAAEFVRLKVDVIV